MRGPKSFRVFIAARVAGIGHRLIPEASAPLTFEPMENGFEASDGLVKREGEGEDQPCAAGEAA